MNKYNTTLSNIGLSNYHITKSGKVFDIAADVQIPQGKTRRFWLTDDNGKKRKYSLKHLYRAAYNAEYCIDCVKEKPAEQWKVIPNTDGKYFISNYGRVKSLCKYKAIILQPYQQKNGYLIVKINGQNVKIHRLVAFAFCENKYNDSQKVEIHHLNNRRNDNTAANLCILSAEEHRKIHGKKETATE